MSLFRTIVFVSGLAGLVAGLGHDRDAVCGHRPADPQGGSLSRSQSAPGATAAPTMPRAGQPRPRTATHRRTTMTAWAPADGFERSAFTALANVVTAIGFALLLVTASELSGGLTGWRQGVFWGLAGFAVFTLAPGLGLPPELPGMPAADLGRRSSGGSARRSPPRPASRSWSSGAPRLDPARDGSHRRPASRRRAEARQLRDRGAGRPAARLRGGGGVTSLVFWVLARRHGGLSARPPDASGLASPALHSGRHAPCARRLSAGASSRSSRP